MRIDALDAEGAGTGRLEDRTVTVPGVLPGERVEVELRAGTSRGRLSRVITSSPARIEPRCAHVRECGGCPWQHMAYAEQLRLKRARLQAAVDAAAGRGRVHVGAVAAMPHDGPSGPWGFRHKVHFAFDQQREGRLVMGHLQPGSRRVFDARECPVHAARGNDVAFAVKAALQHAGLPAGPPPRGVVRHVVSRVSRSSGEVVTTLVAAGNPPALRHVSREVIEAGRPDGWHMNLHPRPDSLLFGPRTLHLDGRVRLREDIAGIRFLVSPASFFQTNVEAAAMLAAAVLDAVPCEAMRVLDLYAGLGFFALPLARRGHRVTAVEESAPAVEDGEVSAKANGIGPARCRFVRARAEHALGRLVRQAGTFDAVVLDPPRAGAGAAVIDRVRGIGPGRIVYVSCAPDALARDLAHLLSPRQAQAGYRLVSVTPFDMFPHTPHVEALAVLAREPLLGRAGGTASGSRLSSAR